MILPVAVTAIDRKLLASLARAGRVQWTFHARTRAAERGFRAAVVNKILVDGAIIEDYGDAQPFPSALLHGTVNRRPIHAVVAVDEPGRMAYVISVYEPDSERFEKDRRSRRKRR